MEMHRTIEGKIGTVVISHTPSNRYFASITVDDGLPAPEPVPVEEQSITGVLRGNQALTLSHPDTRLLPRPLLRYLQRLRVLDRRLNRKRRRNPDWCGSARYEALRLQRARLHEHIAAIRGDWHQKTTTAIVAGASAVGVDNTPAAPMMLVNGFSTADAAPFEVTRQLEYKSKRVGKKCLRVEGSTPEEVRQRVIEELL
jgi:putative transposase